MYHHKPSILRRVLILITVVLSSASLCADNLTEARSYLQTYNNMVSSGSAHSVGFNALYSAYTMYKQVVENSEPGSPNYLEAKSALKDIFEGLEEAIYFFFEKNDANQYTKMGVAYADISLMLCMQREGLTKRDNYSNLLAFTARAAEDRGDYETAILLNQAYLNTPDQNNRIPVMQSLAMSHLALGHYDDFKSVCETALKQHPEDQFLASKAYSVCRDKGDDMGMAVFGEYYARFDPSMRITLLWNKAKMLDDQQQYTEAVELWKQLDRMSPNNEEVYVHIGFDSYNAGVLLYNRAMGKNYANRDQAIMKAKSYFRNALPYLDDIAAQPKYRTASNVATAIASCHSIIGDSKALAQDNAWLKSLGAATVKAGDIPQLQTAYKPIISDPGSRPEPQPVASAPTIISDVDRDLPKLGRENKNTYVVIIGNEVYSHMNNNNVKFAQNDARSFKKYCIEVLGIPAHHIRDIENATAFQMDDRISFLEDKAKSNPNELRFIVYYAGHGTPDLEHDGTPYLLPCDADGSNLKGCLSLKELCDRLEALPTKSVTLFLDACFTGFSREGKSLVDGRWVGFAPKKVDLNKKLVVFSATSNKQRALPFEEQGHGFFTYFLLKNLKATQGTINYEELARRLTKQVDNEAKDRTNMSQTPQISVSKALGEEWKKWTLID